MKPSFKSHWSHAGVTCAALLQCFTAAFFPVTGRAELEVVTSTLPDGMEVVEYSVALQATNGIPPYTWSVMPGVVSWGDNRYGQTNVPPGLVDVKAIACGGSHSLALKSDGSVVAWGDNSEGQTNVPFGLTDVTTISGGGSHSLALKSDGTVVAWGGDGHGQTNVPFELSNVVAIAGGGSHCLALQANGIVVAWGDNDFGQSTCVTNNITILNEGKGIVPYSSFSGQCDHFPLKPGKFILYIDNGTVGQFTDNGAGGLYGHFDFHGMTMGAYGSIDYESGVYSIDMGSPGYVTIGHAVTLTYTVPNGGTYDASVTAVSGGGAHSLVLRSDGSVFVWGDNGFGQTNVPTELTNAVAIAAGGSHCMAMTSDGNVVAWGDNREGQTNAPYGLLDVMAISGGGSHSLALMSNNTVVSWGSNGFGQTNVPSDLTDVVAISGGGSHSLALRSNSTQLPKGLTCTGEGVVSGVPTQPGIRIVTFVVRDSVGAIAEKQIQILIEGNPNTRPVIVSSSPPTGEFSMGEGTSQVFQVWAYDPEGSNLTFSWTWDGALIGDNSSQCTITTALGDAGLHTMRCNVSDDLWQNIVSAQWNVIVLDDNDSDGMSNTLEIDLGRNPNDPNDSGTSSVLTGTVRGSGGGLSNAYVRLFGLSDQVYHEVYTDGSGAYTINEVFPGKYYIKVGAERFADEWYSKAIHRSHALPYSVSANSTIEGFDFDLDAGQNPVLVQISSDPAGALIYLDYQPTGCLTPALLNVGEVGTIDDSGYRIASHVISVKRFGSPRPSPRAVAAREAETVDVNFHMTSDASGWLSITTVPDGSDVFVDYADPLPNGSGGLPTNEVINTSYSGNSITFTTGRAPILPGSITVLFADGVHGSVTDNGAGSLNGNYQNAIPGPHQANGTVIYSNGEVSVFFPDILGLQSSSVTIRYTVRGLESNPPNRFVPPMEEISPSYSGNSLSFTTHYQPIRPGSVTVSIADGTRGVVTDDSFGSLSGNYLNVIPGSHPANGTVVYVNGQVNIFFPDVLGLQSSRVTISYEVGTESDGVSPVVVNNLAPGAHSILLRKTGYMQPRPVVAWVQAGYTNEIMIPMPTNSSSDRLLADVQSVSSGAVIYVDYLPVTNVTDAIVDWMDPASHAGSGWYSVSHTIMLRKTGSLPMAPRYVPDYTNQLQTMVIHLLGDPEMDEDHDGMPDLWEDAYRLRELAPGQHGAADDPDRDGFSNFQEMTAGTNPLDEHSRLAFAGQGISAFGSDQEVTFIFDTVRGRAYNVQCAGDLRNSWTNLSGLILATNSQTVYTTHIPEGTAHQYYRLIVLPR